MTILLATSQHLWRELAKTKLKPGITGHWVVALAVIAVAAALTIPQIDMYMIARDVPSSLQGAGWVADRPYSPIDVINSVYAHTPDQGPAYHLLLNLWGRLVGHEIALGRMLGIYFGILSLAMAYRLGRDTISPIAGNFAIIIMASNAFYNFYYSHIRTYSLLVLLSAIVIWLYLRIATRERPRRRRVYVALAGACAALVNTHSFGLLLYLVLSLHHLLFVRIGRRWLAVAAVAHIGLALGSLHIIAMLAQGIELGGDPASPVPSADGFDVVFAAWLNVTTNGGPLLLFLAAVGAALAWRQKSKGWRRSVVLFPLLLIAVVAVYVSIGAIPPQTTRYWLAGLPVAVLFQAAGLNALYCRRSWLGALIALWIVAGLSFGASADWNLYIRGRLFSYHLPPWHLVSRTAERSGVPAKVFAFMLPEKLMWSPRFGPVGLREHWFDRRQIDLRWVGDVYWLEERARHFSRSAISPWVVYQTSRIDDATVEKLEYTMAEQGFQACQRVSLPASTEMARYSWVALDCAPARVLKGDRVAPLGYDFFGANLTVDGARLYFANRLTAQSDEAIGRLNISHQLISDDWKNVGQLDMPLPPRGELRQYAIDVSQFPPGRYRLVAIVYDRSTGKTLDWQEESGGPSYILSLQEVEIRHADNAP